MKNLPPSPSPVRPERRIIRRKYSEHQIKEAMALAREVSVAYAEQMTGVQKWWIYKNLKPTKQMLAPSTRKAPRPTYDELFMNTPAFAQAVKAALAWSANSEGILFKKECFKRAAKKFHLDYQQLYRCYRKQLFTT